MGFLTSIFVVLLAVQKSNATTFEYTVDWHSRHVANWNQLLKDLKGKDNLKYLELGVYEGRSFFWTLDNILTGEKNEAVAIDRWGPAGTSIGDVKKRFDKNLKLTKFKGKISVHEGLSSDYLPSLKKNNFDLIYVDADHAAHSVLEDAVLAWRLLKTGGILIFDDFRMGKDDMPVLKRPEISIDTFLRVNEREIEVLHKEYQVVIRKIERKDILGCNYGSCSQIGKYYYFWFDNVVRDHNFKKLDLSDEELLSVRKLLRISEDNHVPIDLNLLRKIAQ